MLLLLSGGGGGAQSRPLPQTRHLALARGERGPVLLFRDRSFAGVVPRVARVNFGVERAAEGFSDALLCIVPVSKSVTHTLTCSLILSVKGGGRGGGEELYMQSHGRRF